MSQYSPPWGILCHHHGDFQVFYMNSQYIFVKGTGFIGLSCFIEKHYDSLLLGLCLVFGRFPEISIPIATVTNGRTLRVVVVFFLSTGGT